MSFENDLELLIDIERLIKRLGQHGWKRLEALIDGCRPPHPPPPPRGPWLTINDVSVQLIANQEIKMSTDVFIGHTVNFGISQVDTTGLPMVTPVAFDAAPTWAESSTDGSIETLTVAGDGLTAVGSAVGAGTDTVTATVIVGGVSFSASVDVVVSAEPQVFGGIVVTTEVS